MLALITELRGTDSTFFRMELTLLFFLQRNSKLQKLVQVKKYMQKYNNLACNNTAIPISIECNAGNLDKSIELYGWRVIAQFSSGVS